MCCTLSFHTKFVADRRLPIEYKQLEARVDALKDVHQKMLKITKVYETETVSCAACSLSVILNGDLRTPRVPEFYAASCGI